MGALAQHSGQFAAKLVEVLNRGGVKELAAAGGDGTIANNKELQALLGKVGGFTLSAPKAGCWLLCLVRREVGLESARGGGAAGSGRD